MSFLINPYKFSLYDVDAADWFARLVSGGSSILTANKLPVSTFITQCKADASPIGGVSNWAAMKECCLLSGPADLTGALIPLKGSAPTNVAYTSGDYSRTGGLAGNGTTQNLVAARNNNADPQDNQSMGVFVASTGSSSAGRYIGTPSSGNCTDIVAGASSARLDPRVRCQVATLQTHTAATGTGLIGVSRHQAPSFVATAWGTTSTISVASAAPKTSAIGISADGASANRLPMTFKFYWIGEAVDMDLLRTRLTTLFGSIV